MISCAVLSVVGLSLIVCFSEKLVKGVVGTPLGFRVSAAGREPGRHYPIVSVLAMRTSTLFWVWTLARQHLAIELPDRTPGPF